MKKELQWRRWQNIIQKQYLGIKITGERTRTGKEEIDLCFCNTSLNENLWKLGTITIVECKNQNKSFSNSDVKKIVQTMEDKTAQSSILFLRKDITDAAQKEIDEQLMYGKYIIIITKKDLEKMNCTPYELLIEKIQNIEERQEFLMESLF